MTTAGTRTPARRSGAVNTIIPKTRQRGAAGFGAWGGDKMAEQCWKQQPPATSDEKRKLDARYHNHNRKINTLLLFENLVCYY